jgi:hypothetical protein
MFAILTTTTIEHPGKVDAIILHFVGLGLKFYSVTRQIWLAICGLSELLKANFRRQEQLS